MAYIVKCLVLALSTFALILQCNPEAMSNKQDRIPDNKNEQLLLGIADSLIATIPIIQDDYFMHIDNLLLTDGLEISKEHISSLLKQDIGIIFPRGIKVQPTDIDKRFSPRIKMFLIGKWSTSANYFYYLLKCMFDNGIYVYLLSVNDNLVDNADMISYYCQNNEHISYCDEGESTYSLMSIKQSESIIIYSIDKFNNKQVIRKITLQH